MRAYSFELMRDTDTSTPIKMLDDRMQIQEIQQPGLNPPSLLVRCINSFFGVSIGLAKFPAKNALIATFR